MRFKEGRQGTGYEVMTLFSLQLPFDRLTGIDAHILRYRPGTSIPKHVDKVKSGNHHRINIILKKPPVGGVFKCSVFKKWGPVIYFRPDLYEHEVTEVQGGNRIALSIGWVTF